MAQGAEASVLCLVLEAHILCSVCLGLGLAWRRMYPAVCCVVLGTSLQPCAVLHCAKYVYDCKLDNITWRLTSEHAGRLTLSWHCDEVALFQCSFPGDPKRKTFMRPLALKLSWH